MNTRLWQDVAQTLRRKRTFLTAITILIIANLVIWLDVFRGCATTPKANECDFAFARRPSEIGGAVCRGDSIAGFDFGTNSIDRLRNNKLHVPKLQQAGWRLNRGFRFRKDFFATFFLGKKVETEQNYELI